MNYNNKIIDFEGMNQFIYSKIFGNGTKFAALVLGGRVLGLFGGVSNKNFFWQNPELHDRNTARHLFDSGKWPNTGGDRTWIAPEYDLFFPSYPETKLYCVPPQLDPGKYQLCDQSGTSGGI